MRLNQLSYDNAIYRDDLLPRLRGTVFHVTTQAAFEKIQHDGYIRNNKDGRLRNSYKHSFGSKRGWVCLLDLRTASEEDIDFTLNRYYFLAPDGCSEYAPDYSEETRRLAYLFLNEESFSSIIPNGFALQAYKDEGGPFPFYVPRTECWYPGDIPLNCIDEVLLVSTRSSVDGLLRASLIVAEQQKGRFI